MKRANESAAGRASEPVARESANAASKKMITCPECGQQANDDAKFCDCCGQGLADTATHPLATSIPPFEPATELKGGYRIVALLGQTAHENRYRAERLRDCSVESVQLREQLGPVSGFVAEGVAAGPAPPPAEDDPAGPHAKTAELRLKQPPPGHDSAANGSPEAHGLEPQTASGEAEPSLESDAPADVEAPPQDEAAEAAEVSTAATDLHPHLLTETVENEYRDGRGAASAVVPAANDQAGKQEEPSAEAVNDDLGDVFGRVLALSMTLNHPAFQRATGGFVERGRVYLVYPDEELRPLSSRQGGLQMDEAEALNVAIQVCQAVNFVHRRGLRVNDICPESVAYGADGRIRLTGLDYISNDNELQSEPVFNDGYTAPEIYRGKKVAKRADVFSIGALLYTCLTGERLDCETWREEAGPLRFYPPHVVTPALERTIRRALLFDPAARWPSVDAFKAELVRFASAPQVRAGALTDVGMVREHNEDALLAFECARDSLIDPAQTFLYVVADGMGGAEAGEVASAIAVGAIRNYVEDKLAGSGAAGVRAILQEALEQANSKIIEYQAAHPEARGMGSTAVAALLAPPQAAIAWVGDSRAYICDGNGLRQLTKDHSLVQRLIEIGQISAEEARQHEHKNVITRSLGARPTGPAGAESLALRLKRGDRLMLCSDGLTAHVEDRQIDALLRRHSDPTAAARELVVAANAGGGTDNVSVVVIVAG